MIVDRSHRLPYRCRRYGMPPMSLRDMIPLDGPLDDATRDLTTWPDSIPLRERLLDRMGDLLFCAEDLLDMLRHDHDRHRFTECERPIRTARDAINSLMKTLCD